MTKAAKSRAEFDELDRLYRRIADLLEQSKKIQDEIEYVRAQTKRHSVAEVTRRVLRSNPEGLKLAVLVDKLEERGWRPTGKNPGAILCTILRRQAPDIDVVDGRWKIVSAE